jgi:hypothetical protein
MKRLFLSGSVLALATLVAVAPLIQATKRQPSTNHEEIAEPDRQLIPERTVDFGVNGHPLNPGTYSNMPLEQQLSLLRTLKLRTYRVNVNPSHPETFAKLSELVDLARSEGIRILPVIVLPPKQYSNEDTAYDDAHAKVYRLAKQFDTRIIVWELGNEYDLFCVMRDADGSSPGDYDPEKYAIVRGLIRGMRAAVDEASPASQNIIQTSQHTPTSLDSGFLQKLIQDGLTYDITGYHYYSNGGQIPTGKGGRNALEVLHELHKPIWITEFNKSASSRTVGPSANPQQQAIALTEALNQITARANTCDVIGADVYELLDQPELLTNPGVNPSQAEFGILTSHGDFTAASRAVQNFLRIY